MDADHLDIYGTEEKFQEGFEEFVALIETDGLLIYKYGLPLESECPQLSYAVNNDDADFTIENIRFDNQKFLFTVIGPQWEWENVELGIPGIHNAENALSCIILCLWLGLSEETIRHGLSTFKGVKRRFEYHIRTKDFVYLDDYAHHPAEIKSLLDSIDLLYPNRKKIGIFQPHLFSRTRDFFDGFVEQLSRLDECILMAIYPARENPIEGITSEKLLEKITSPKKVLLSPNKIPQYVANKTDSILMTIGAGDIDRIVESIKLTKEG
jgi:UDP-N-acetylmuramate--alanine ligase